MVWDLIEAVALVCIVVGGFLMWGPLALIAGGFLVLCLSWLANRRGER